jgi:hypothetical protein
MSNDKIPYWGTHGASSSGFLGPLPESTSGNTNILVMVDQYTKWVECIALPSQRAEVTARDTVNQFLAKFGYPFNLYTIRDATLRVDFLNRFARYSKYTKIALRLTVRQQTDKLKGSTEALWMQYVVL